MIKFTEFIDSLVRPVITLGFASVVVYMAIVQGIREAVTVVTTTAVLVIGFWFKDRVQEKAALVAAKVAEEKVMNDQIG